MTFTSALDVLRRRWRLLVIGAVAGLLVGGLVTAVTPQRHVAEAGVYVAGLDTVPSRGADFYVNLQLIQQRVTSYQELMVAGDVLGPAGARAGAVLTPGNVAVRPGKASSVFGVVVVDGDPRRAVASASAVAERFAEVVADVDRPAVPGAVAGVRATVVDRPATATPSGPGPGTALLVGLMSGVLVAAAWAIGRAVVARPTGRGRRDDEPGAVDAGDPDGSTAADERAVR